MNKNIIPLMGFECENAKVQGRLKRLLRDFEQRYKERSLINVFAFLEHANSLKNRPSWFIFHEWENTNYPINGVNLPVFCNLLSHNEQGNFQDFEGNIEEIEQENECYSEEPYRNYKGTLKYSQVIEQLEGEFGKLNPSQLHTIDTFFEANSDLPGYAIQELIQEQFKAQEPTKKKDQFIHKKPSEPAQDDTLPTIEPSVASQLFKLLLDHYGTVGKYNAGELGKYARIACESNPHHDAETLLPALITELDKTL